MNVVHCVDQWGIGGIADMVLTLHKHSRHHLECWGYRSSLGPEMEAAGLVIHEGGPNPDIGFDVVVGHGVGGWSHENLAKWAHDRGAKFVECMHSIHLSPTPVESVDFFVGMSHLATQANPQFPNRKTIYVPINVAVFDTVSGPRNKIGKLCRLAQEKSPLEFVELAARFPDEQFVLAGDGPLMGECQARKTPNLELLGMVRDFPSFYGQLKLFVFPTRDECCSQAVAMAMAAGLEVVCQDIPALRETTNNMVAYCSTIDDFVGAVNFSLHHQAYEHQLWQNPAWARTAFDLPVTVSAWDDLIDSLGGE